MGTAKKHLVLLGATSDIGTAMAKRWKDKGWKIHGTYRSKNDNFEELESMDVQLEYCDLLDDDSLESSTNAIREDLSSWDALVLCPGTQKPVGAFDEVDIEQWEQSIQANFTRQMTFLHKLLPARNQDLPEGPSVVMFAGGGTNDAPENYSGYIISKIAQIKMCELLDAEIDDSSFSIIGPGWVKTKIHDATLNAPKQAGGNFERTKEKLQSKECTPMELVLDSIEWVLNAPAEVVSGRNFSTVYDQWGEPELNELLKNNPDYYKLRRAGNDELVRDNPLDRLGDESTEGV